MLFFDGLCISQDDPERKKAGIRALGAFVSRSQRMVVISDRSYWKRLWCLLEIAAFVHKLAKETSIDEAVLEESLRFTSVEATAVTAVIIRIMCLPAALQYILVLLTVGTSVV